MSLGSPPDILPENPETLDLPVGLQLVRFFDPYRGRWDAHRFYGPLPDMRFDHHTPPCGLHPNRSVWYAAMSLRGAVAEVFGRTGILDRGSRVRLVQATIRSSIPVLDLVGLAARSVGLTQEIAATTDYVVCQTWARAFYDQYPNVQGIRWRGRQIGSLCIVLNDRTTMNHLTAEVLGLSEPEIWSRIARAARDCGVRIL